MKKVLNILGIFAMSVAMFSCSKEFDTPASEQVEDRQPETPVAQENDQTPDVQNLDPDKYLVSFGARFEGIESKATVNLTSGEQAFENDDEALVVCGSETGIYVYDATTALFSPKTTADAIELSGQEAQVYYPAAEFAFSAGMVTFTMPAAVGAGSVEDLGDKIPLCGTVPASANPVATFKNLGSILYVRFNANAADGETITAVELSGSGVNITGSGAVTWEENIPVLAPLSGSSAGTSLTIDCALAPKHLTSTDYQEFFFFLPPSGSFADMQLKAVYGKTDGANNYTLYELVNRTGAMTLGRGKLVKVQKTLNGFFSGGDGSSSHPYLISSCEDFKALSTMGNVTANANSGKLYYEYNSTAARNFFRSSGANYRQTADLDFGNADLTDFMVGIAGSNSDAASFKGHYDGNEKKISNYSINAPDKNWVGLFANMQGEVKNLELENISVVGKEAVGGIVGWLDGKVTDCSVTGTSSVTGTNGVAGIAANIRNSSEVSGCTNYATINGAGNSGGIVGYMAHAGKIVRCTNRGAVNSTGWTVGGVLGNCNNSGGKVLGCQNFASVTSTQGNVGGIVGGAANGMEINASSSPSPSVITRNEGAVSGTQSVGGIIGRLGGGSVACSTNTGTVTGSSNNVGGIVGYKVSGGVWSAVRNQGNITGTHSVGGIVGYQANGGLCGNLTSGNKNNRIVNEGTVTATGKDGSNYSAAGGIIGRMDGGTLGDATAIKTAENEGNVTGTGSGDGVGGIVGWLNAGTVARCRSNETITNNRKCVGGAIGWMTAGTIINCYAKGIVTGQGQVGGFVGYLFASADSYIINCAAGAERVVATNKNTNDGVGGFVGYMNQSTGNADKQAVIANCVVWDGIIKAPNEDNSASNKIRVGGFAGVGYAQSGGKANSLIQNCYYQGLPTHVGYGGAADDDSLPSINCSGTGVVGGFIGYAGGTTKDCYCDRSTSTAYKLAGSGSVSNGGRLITDIVYGRSKITWDVKTSAGTVNNVYLDELLNKVVDSVGNLGDIALSQWTSYTVGTDKYYYPDILTSMGETFYKK